MRKLFLCLCCLIVFLNGFGESGSHQSVSWEILDDVDTVAGGTNHYVRLSNFMDTNWDNITDSGTYDMDNVIYQFGEPMKPIDRDENANFRAPFQFQATRTKRPLMNTNFQYYNVWGSSIFNFEPGTATTDENGAITDNFGKNTGGNNNYNVGGAFYAHEAGMTGSWWDYSTSKRMTTSKDSEGNHQLDFRSSNIIGLGGSGGATNDVLDAFHENGIYDKTPNVPNIEALELLTGVGGKIMHSVGTTKHAFQQLVQHTEGAADYNEMAPIHVEELTGIKSQCFFDSDYLSENVRGGVGKSAAVYAGNLALNDKSYFHVDDMIGVEVAAEISMWSQNEYSQTDSHIGKAPAFLPRPSREEFNPNNPAHPKVEQYTGVRVTSPEYYTSGVCKSTMSEGEFDVMEKESNSHLFVKKAGLVVTDFAETTTMSVTVGDSTENTNIVRPSPGSVHIGDDENGFSIISRGSVKIGDNPEKDQLIVNGDIILNGELKMSSQAQFDDSDEDQKVEVDYESSEYLFSETIDTTVAPNGLKAEIELGSGTVLGLTSGTCDDAMTIERSITAIGKGTDVNITGDIVISASDTNFSNVNLKNVTITQPNVVLSDMKISGAVTISANKVYFQRVSFGESASVSINNISTLASELSEFISFDNCVFRKNSGFSVVSSAEKTSIALIESSFCTKALNVANDNVASIQDVVLYADKNRFEITRALDVTDINHEGFITFENSDDIKVRVHLRDNSFGVIPSDQSAELSYDGNSDIINNVSNKDLVYFDVVDLSKIHLDSYIVYSRNLISYPLGTTGKYINLENDESDSITDVRCYYNNNVSTAVEIVEPASYSSLRDAGYMLLNVERDFHMFRLMSTLSLSDSIVLSPDSSLTVPMILEGNGRTIQNLTVDSKNVCIKNLTCSGAIKIRPALFPFESMEDYVRILDCTFSKSAIDTVGALIVDGNNGVDSSKYFGLIVKRSVFTNANIVANCKRYPDKQFYMDFRIRDNTFSESSASTIPYISIKSIDDSITNHSIFNGLIEGNTFYLDQTADAISIKEIDANGKIEVYNNTMIYEGTEENALPNMINLDGSTIASNFYNNTIPENGQLYSNNEGEVTEEECKVNIDQDLDVNGDAAISEDLLVNGELTVKGDTFLGEEISKTGTYGSALNIQKTYTEKPSADDTSIMNGLLASSILELDTEDDFGEDSVFNTGGMFYGVMAKPGKYYGDSNEDNIHSHVQGSASFATVTSDFLSMDDYTFTQPYVDLVVGAENTSALVGRIKNSEDKNDLMSLKVKDGQGALNLTPVSVGEMIGTKSEVKMDTIDTDLYTGHVYRAFGSQSVLTALQKKSKVRVDHAVVMESRGLIGSWIDTDVSDASAEYDGRLSSSIQNYYGMRILAPEILSSNDDSIDATANAAIDTANAAIIKKKTGLLVQDFANEGPGAYELKDDDDGYSIVSRGSVKIGDFNNNDRLVINGDVIVNGEIVQTKGFDCHGNLIQVNPNASESDSERGIYTNLSSALNATEEGDMLLLFESDSAYDFGSQVITQEISIVGDGSYPEVTGCFELKSKNINLKGLTFVGNSSNSAAVKIYGLNSDEAKEDYIKIIDCRFDFVPATGSGQIEAYSYNGDEVLDDLFFTINECQFTQNNGSDLGGHAIKIELDQFPENVNFEISDNEFRTNTYLSSTETMERGLVYIHVMQAAWPQDRVIFGEVKNNVYEINGGNSVSNKVFPVALVGTSNVRFQLLVDDEKASFTIDSGINNCYFKKKSIYLTKGSMVKKPQLQNCVFMLKMTSGVEAQNDAEIDLRHTEMTESLTVGNDQLEVNVQKAYTQIGDRYYIQPSETVSGEDALLNAYEQAVDGDTIVLDAGEYVLSSTFNIEKSIKLMSQNRQAVIRGKLALKTKGIMIEGIMFKQEEPVVVTTPANSTYGEIPRAQATINENQSIMLYSLSEPLTSKSEYIRIKDCGFESQPGRYDGQISTTYTVDNVFAVIEDCDFNINLNNPLESGEHGGNCIRIYTKDVMSDMDLIIRNNTFTETKYSFNDRAVYYSFIFIQGDSDFPVDKLNIKALIEQNKFFAWRTTMGVTAFGMQDSNGDNPGVEILVKDNVYDGSFQQKLDGTYDYSYSALMYTFNSSTKNGFVAKDNMIARKNGRLIYNLSQKADFKNLDENQVCEEVILSELSASDATITVSGNLDLGGNTITATTLSVATIDPQADPLDITGDVKIHGDIEATGSSLVAGSVSATAINAQQTTSDDIVTDQVQSSGDTVTVNDKLDVQGDVNAQGSIIAESSKWQNFLVTSNSVTNWNSGAVMYLTSSTYGAMTLLNVPYMPGSVLTGIKLQYKGKLDVKLYKKTLTSTTPIELQSFVTGYSSYNTTATFTLSAVTLEEGCIYTIYVSPTTHQYPCELHQYGLQTSKRVY